MVGYSKTNQTLLEKVITPHNMNKAWRRFDTDKATWKPGVRKVSIERDMTYHLMTLANEMQQGTYRPENVRRFRLMTVSGKSRDIAALCLRDKVAQRAVLQVLEPIAEREMHRSSFGYRPGRNTEMAYNLARTYIADINPWLVHTDIKSFFDQIPLGALKAFMKNRIDDPRILAIINTSIDQHATISPRPWRKARGVPQGGILSPLLGNWFLTQLDNKLARKKLNFVRYADDILICTKNELDAQKVLVYLEKQVNKLGLQLNKEKTKIIHSSPKVTYLGHKMPKVRK
jgi:RNA-directed DNA polymerase